MILKLQLPQSRYYALEVIAHLFLKKKCYLEVVQHPKQSGGTAGKTEIILVTTFYYLRIQDIKISSSSWLGDTLEIQNTLYTFKSFVHTVDLSEFIL